jgi:hypothetical protein
MNFLFLLAVSSCSVVATAEEPFVANYDESQVPDYTLPDPLRMESGAAVTTPAEWNEVRRGEILEQFQRAVYGRAPQACPLRHTLVSVKEDAIGGQAIRREVDLFFGDGTDAPSLRMLIYTPRSGDGPAPAFLGLNFLGNHSLESDPSLTLTDRWVVERANLTAGNRALDSSRGAAAPRWPVETIIARGYGLVTIYYGDIDPDFDDGFQNGIHAALGWDHGKIPSGERWGSIATWAYGLSRVLDYLQQDERVDATRVAVIGHSRLGKTALWAGASDSRFAMVISNNSGCGGAALSRRGYGETIARINRAFPHWFCDNFQQYNHNEAACPVDQHQLIALIAPRPVYIASASEDRWADPRGEFLAAVHADPVYRLLGTRGLGGDAPPPEMPATDMPISSGSIGYHLRSGKHDITAYDWAQYLDFADRHLR